MPALVDILGKTFNRLTVLSRAGIDKHGEVLWRCVCACGSHVVVRGNKLRSGHTQSCGCLQRERTSKALTKHGNCSNPLYQIYTNMHGRCKYFELYTAQNITVCSEWMSFEGFCKDMEPSWSPGLSLDRIDNSKGYSPENCRWATRMGQIRNRTCTIWVEIEGNRMTLKEANRIVGIVHYRSALKRVHKGWDAYTAIMTPPRKNNGY